MIGGMAVSAKRAMNSAICLGLGSSRGLVRLFEIVWKARRKAVAPCVLGVGLAAEGRCGALHACAEPMPALSASRRVARLISTGGYRHEEGRRDAKNVPSQQRGIAAPHAPARTRRRGRSRGKRLRSVSRLGSGASLLFIRTSFRAGTDD